MIRGKNQGKIVIKNYITTQITGTAYFLNLRTAASQRLSVLFRIDLAASKVDLLVSRIYILSFLILIAKSPLLSG